MWLLLNVFKKTLLLEFTDFQDFPGPPTILKDFPVLEKATLKCKYFPGPVRTLYTSPITEFYTRAIANDHKFNLLN